MKAIHEGHAFRRARVDAGLALREVAGRLGISAVRLGEFERGVASPFNGWQPMYDALVSTSVPPSSPGKVEP